MSWAGFEPQTPVVASSDENDYTIPLPQIFAKILFKIPSVIVMPPLGQAPANSPQPGQPGGGELPISNSYAAALAPEGKSWAFRLFSIWTSVI